MHSGERGMNPVTMTILNPWKEYLPRLKSNLQPVRKVPIAAHSKDVCLHVQNTSKSHSYHLKL